MRSNQAANEIEQRPNGSAVYVTPAKWIKPHMLPLVNGMTAEAARKKRERGEWLEGKHWVYAPDGTIRYNWREIDLWAEGQN